MMLDGWFVHTVTRKRLLTTPPTGKGDPAYTAEDTISARVEKNTKLVTRADGTQALSQYVLACQTPVATTDLFWFPSIAGEPADDTSSNAKARRPLSIDVATTKNGLQSLWQVRF